METVGVKAEGRRQKAKGKRQKAKLAGELAFFLLPFAFCLAGDSVSAHC
jgi:hypothetical protein